MNADVIIIFISLNDQMTAAKYKECYFQMFCSTLGLAAEEPKI